jgi:hypothetical protein
MPSSFIKEVFLMSLKKALSQPGNFPVALDDDEGPEYWQNHLGNWARSGLSQAAYCRNNGVLSASVQKPKKIFLRVSRSGA